MLCVSKHILDSGGEAGVAGAGNPTSLSLTSRRQLPIKGVGVGTEVSFDRGANDLAGAS